MSRNVFQNQEEALAIDVEVEEEVPDEVLKRLDDEKDFTRTAMDIKNERLKRRKEEA